MTVTDLPRVHAPLPAAPTEPLLPVAGADLRAPLAGGGDARYVNLDYAASAPALRAVADHVAEILPTYASVHRGAGYPSQLSTRRYEDARRPSPGSSAPATTTSWCSSATPPTH